MEQVVVMEGCKPTKFTYSRPPPVVPVRQECVEECCPEDILEPLKRNCLCMSQTPVLFFILLLSLAFIIAMLGCWWNCSCPDDCKSKDGGQCDTDSTARWTAFALSTLIYVMLAILGSIWLYRLFQISQTRSLAITMSVALPVFAWWFFTQVNVLMFPPKKN